MKKTIGILGGMGPEATDHIFGLLIKHTAAAKDQDHIRVLIWSNPEIPPRTDAIIGKGPSPLPALLEGLDRLERAGADIFVMPCITAHFWAAEIASHAKIPFVNLLQESLAWARQALPRLKKAGVVATSGTIATGLWPKTFAKRGIDVIAPGPSEQVHVMEAILGRGGIKSGVTTGKPRATIVRAARRLVASGAEAIIAGCTEVPLVLKEKDLSVPLIEPMKIGALACIRKAGYRVKI
jgi:aspartate racemase